MARWSPRVFEPPPEAKDLGWVLLEVAARANGTTAENLDELLFAGRVKYGGLGEQRRHGASGPKHSYRTVGVLECAEQHDLSGHLKAAGIAVRGKGGRPRTWPPKPATTTGVSTDPGWSKPAISGQVSADSGASPWPPGGDPARVPASRSVS